jgi:hypothetical protein
LCGRLREEARAAAAAERERQTQQLYSDDEEEEEEASVEQGQEEDEVEEFEVTFYLLCAYKFLRFCERRCWVRGGRRKEPSLVGALRIIIREHDASKKLV